MHSYFLNESPNILTIRVREVTTTSSLHLHWKDLMGHQTGSQQIFPQAYDVDESLIEFTYGLPASGSDQYMITLTSGSEQIWHGEVEVFVSSSVKSEYESKNNQYIPHTSNNDFIIYYE